MAVKIRLRRMGERNTPFYRIVVTDARSPVKGRFIETIGWYDPQRKGLAMELKRDRYDYWSGVGAEVSQTVKTLVKKLQAQPKATAETAAPQPLPAEAAPEAEQTAEESAAAGEPESTETGVGGGESEAPADEEAPERA